MRAYQREKSDLLTSDRTILVIRALLALVPDDTNDAYDAADTSTTEVSLTSSKIAEVVKRIANEDEQDGEWASPSRVGRILKRLRVPQANRTAATRGWSLTASSVLGLARAYGVMACQPSATPEEGDDSADDDPCLDIPASSVMRVTSVTSVTPQATAVADERERFEL
jgi:hypothetical protein